MAPVLFTTLKTYHEGDKWCVTTDILGVDDTVLMLPPHHRGSALV